MKFMLDANALIATLTGTSAEFGARITACDEGDLATSAIVFAEVALGSWHGKRPSSMVLDQISNRIAILPFDHHAAKIYAQLPFKRGSDDRLIAAHALSSGLTLVTANERDFTDIPGLRVENWTL